MRSIKNKINIGISQEEIFYKCDEKTELTIIPILIIYNKYVTRLSQNGLYTQIVSLKVTEYKNVTVICRSNFKFNNLHAESEKCV